MQISRAMKFLFLTTVVLGILQRPITLYAKDGPEAELLRDGRLYEAARLLEKQIKDPGAQRRSAELYFKLALYDQAFERLMASGVDRKDAAITAISEAFTQGNRSAALRLARANGLQIQATAEIARRELAEGKALAALLYARESEDPKLIASTGRAAYEEAVSSEPYIMGHISKIPRQLRFSPEGRFLILTNADCSEIEVQDLRLRPDRPLSERCRLVEMQFPVDQFAMDMDGRFLVLIGRDKEKNSKENLMLRMERLDTALTVQKLVLSSRFPKEKVTALVFLDDILCAAFGRTLVLFDPWSGDVKATAQADEAIDSLYYLPDTKIVACRLSGSGRYATFSSTTLQSKKTDLAPAFVSLPATSFFGAGVLVDTTHGYTVFIPSSSAEDIRVEPLSEKAMIRRGPLSQPLGSMKELRYSGGVDAALSPNALTVAILAREGVVLAPFPFLDRGECAASLAKEFGMKEQFAVLCGYLLDAGNYDEAERLWTIAAVDEKTKNRMFAESKLRQGKKIEAAYDFIKAGASERALEVADSLIQSAFSLPELKQNFSDCRSVYEKAGVPIDRLARAAGKKAEAISAFAEAVDFYFLIGAQKEIERLAFVDGPSTIEWCLDAGAKLGLSQNELYAQAARALEGRQKWGDAAVAYLWLRDDAGLSRMAKTAFAGNVWDEKLLDSLKKRADPTLCHFAGESLLTKGEYVHAAGQFAAIKDLNNVERVADRALDTDDFIFASELYTALGVKNAKATTAARLTLVFSQIETVVTETETYLSQENVDAVNANRIIVQWPIPASKKDDPTYLQIKQFGEALLALSASPRSAEAKRCASYVSKEANKKNQTARSAEAEALIKKAARFTLAARLLSAMGR